MERQQKVAIVTVHGTGDTAEAPDGDKWFQRGSQFTERMRARLAAGGLDAEIIPHLWSGANSASEREKGADKLSDRIKKISKRYASLHVVGHSHGGNVANDAAVLLKWGLRGRRRERMHSLTTVGTPFFDARTGWLQVLAGLLFNVLTWGAIIAFPIVALALLAIIIASGSTAQLPLWFAYVAIVGPCMWFMMRMASQGIRRILRPRGGKRTSTTIFSIWHKSDEAIAFLQRVEELPIEPFARGALFRGSRGAAISIGVMSVIIMAVGIPTALLLGFDPLGLSALGAPIDQNVTDGATLQQEGAQVFAVAAAILLFAILLAPPMFTLVYLLFRYLFGGAQEIAVRGSLNRFVGGVLRGIAMGRDGDQILGKVSTTSHTHPTLPYVVSGECALRMEDGAARAADKLIEKYRWALFSVGGDSSTSLTALTKDTMTWDSLIHTTYFDQPEVADLIADHIIEKTK